MRHGGIAEEACRNRIFSKQYRDRRSNRVAAFRPLSDLRMKSVQVGRKRFAAPGHRAWCMEIRDSESKRFSLHMGKLLVFPLELASQRLGETNGWGSKQAVGFVVGGV